MPGAEGGPLLELDGVDAGYGSMQILHGVSLRVNHGEIVSVIGPNGAGKSTTFKVIMGLITHLGGRIAFDGQSLVGLRPDCLCMRIPAGYGVLPPLHGAVQAGCVPVVRLLVELGADLEQSQGRKRYEEEPEPGE